MIDEPLQIPETELLVEIEPELRRLHGNLRAQARRLDRVERGEVVPRDVLGLLNAREVLAQLREDCADALALLSGGRVFPSPLP